MNTSLTGSFLVGALIDIDASYFVVLGLFLLLAVILNFVLFKPLMALEDKRRARTSGARESAAELQQRAGQVERDYEKAIRQARQQSSEDRSRVRDEALQQQRAALGQARQKTDRKLQSEMDSLWRDYEDSTRRVDESAQELGAAIANRLLRD